MPKPGERDYQPAQPVISQPPVRIAAPPSKPLTMPADMIRARATPEDLDARRKSYWLGTLPGGPYQNTDFGGQSFPLFSSEVNGTGDETERARMFGNVVRLLAEEVQGILLDVAGKVMQAGHIRCKASKHYRWDATDEEAGCFVYMVEVADGFRAPSFNAKTLKRTNKDGEVVFDPWTQAPPPLVARNREAVSA